MKTFLLAGASIFAASVSPYCAYAQMAPPSPPVATPVTVTTKWVRMGGAALQQWSATLYGAKASYGVQDWFVGYTAVLFITGPMCKLPT